MAVLEAHNITKVYPEGARGGVQKQRVAIARALASAPPIVLDNLPTANLDTHSGVKVLDRCRQLRRAPGDLTLACGADL